MNKIRVCQTIGDVNWSYLCLDFTLVKQIVCLGSAMKEIQKKMNNAYEVKLNNKWDPSFHNVA